MAAVQSRSPYDGRVVARFEQESEEELDAALDRVRVGARRWAATDPRRRAAVLAAMAEGLGASAEQLVRTVVYETGKRISEAAAEVEWAAESAPWYAANPPSDTRSRAPWCARCPSGSWPRSRPGTRRSSRWPGLLFPALMAGNGVVWKPSELATGTAVALAGLLHEAGLPERGGRKQSGNGVPEGGRYAYAGMSEYQAIYGLERATA